jgi:alanine racemase
VSAATERGPVSVSRASAIVDLDAIERNCALLGGELGEGVELCAVVKADGYGHGAVACARAALAGGATWLAVATAREAAILRAEAPEARLLVLGAMTPAELDLALGANADIGVWRAGFLELVRARGAALGMTPRVHVKYDTGMGRLGERDPAAVRALVRDAAADPGLEAVGLWTHFATADEPGSIFFDQQLDRFRELALPLREELPGILLHAANSAAVLREPASHLDMARCGVAIYGLDPFGEDPAARGLQPALELRSYVADLARFDAGDSAGYGQTWRAPEPTYVGVLPIGYGDGVRRALSNRAEILIGGRRRPVVGTISMDNLTVDLGPELDVAPGAPAVLIGAQGDERVLAEETARRLGTINYEVTAALSARVPREYLRS